MILKMPCLCIIIFLVVSRAGMAELADALDSGSSGRKTVQVQILFPAPPAKGRTQGAAVKTQLRFLFLIFNIKRLGLF